MEHAVTGNREGEIVNGARVPDCANCFRRADFSRDFGIGAGGAWWNVEKRFPYALLKLRASDIQRQIGKSIRRIFHVIHNSLDRSGGFGFIVQKVRLGETRLQVFEKSGVAVANEYGDYALIAQRD